MSTEKGQHNMTAATVATIVADYLRGHGYDGLARDECDECGCDLDAFMLCDTWCADCVPGYRWTCSKPCRVRDSDEGCEFADDDLGCLRVERQVP